MSVKTLSRRVAVLENSVPIIDDLADYALWHAHGCDPNARWDPEFKALLVASVRRRQQNETE
jgi:hypothetical protein